jgi:hypothetical protein
VSARLTRWNLPAELNACFLDHMGWHDAVEAQTVEDLSERLLSTEAVLTSLRRAV